MADAAAYRRQAQEMRELAKATDDGDTSLAYNLRAAHLDYLAEVAEQTAAPQAVQLPRASPTPGPAMRQQQQMQTD
jgi:hypothetical protein